MSERAPLLCRCEHREYDHDTEDGSCWKCPCRYYEADHRHG